MPYHFICSAAGRLPSDADGHAGLGGRHGRPQVPPAPRNPETRRQVDARRTAGRRRRGEGLGEYRARLKGGG